MTGLVQNLIGLYTVQINIKISQKSASFVQSFTCTEMTSPSIYSLKHGYTTVYSSNDGFKTK